jgi:hypothetical protein
MKNNKNKKPTDTPMKSENPKNRDFQRTPEETDNVDESENEERRREQNKENRK